MAATDEGDLKRYLELKEFTDKDQDWVSEEERETLAKLKNHPVGGDLCNEGLFQNNDRILYIFLFARKLDVDRTVKLMEKHLVRFILQFL